MGSPTLTTASTLRLSRAHKQCHMAQQSCGSSGPPSVSEHGAAARFDVVRCHRIESYYCHQGNTRTYTTNPLYLVRRSDNVIHPFPAPSLPR